MTNKVKDFLKVIRWQNLVIVFATLWLAKTCLIQSQLNQLSIVYPISTFDLLLCSVAALMIAAAGYIINDLFDKDADKINKPKKALSTISIGEKQLLLFYWILNVLSLIPTFIVFKGINLLIILLLQSSVIAALFFYTNSFKGKGLIGNFSIALLSSLFPIGLWLLLFLSPEYLNLTPEITEKTLFLSAFYSIFAFLLTFIREIVKDLEDREGDKCANYKTFALTHNENIVKSIVFWLLIFFIGLILAFQLYLKQIGYNFFSASFTILYVLLFVFVFPLLKQAKSTQEYHLLSKWLKLIMLLGVVFMLILLL